LLKIKTIIIYVLLLSGLSVIAQDDLILPEIGDVPLASKILVTQDADDPTTAIITGEEGAVFPNAVVVVQNRYTADREITTATVTGSFTTRLYGQKQTPYWIAAFQNFPSEDAINEAMGVTVYGEGDDNTFYVEADLGGNVPRYRISGEVNTTELGDGETLEMSLGVELDVTDSLSDVDGLEFRLDMQLIEFEQTTPAPPITHTATQIGTTAENKITFNLNFEFAPLFYAQAVPYFTGYVRTSNGEWERWEESTLLASPEVSNTVEHTSYLPMIIQRQDISEENIIEWDLMRDIFHNGLVGLLNVTEFPSENRVKLRGSLNVFPPSTYPLEFAIVDSSLSNISSVVWTGSVDVEIIHPSGARDEISAQILQAQTYLNNERVILTLDNPKFDLYPFDEYGDYVILFQVNLEIGNTSFFTQRAFSLRIAETLYLSPSVLLGTPFEIDNTVALGGHVYPPVPAEILIGFASPTSVSAEVTANRFGYFAVEPLLIDKSDMYSVSYVATYEDDLGRLWSSQQMITSSFVGNINSKIDINGKRGLKGYTGQQQAWFDTNTYPNDEVNSTRQPFAPYFSGDIAYVLDSFDGGIVPVLTSSYLPTVYSPYSTSILNMVSPNGMMRFATAFYLGLDTSINGFDTFNQQIGMGVDGIREGDYAFLFGGIWAEEDTNIYGALMVVEDEDAPARVLSPFMDTLNVFGQEVDMFFVPTGIRPAQVLELGDTLSIVGQVAPTLPAEVTVTVTSPSGERTRFIDVANAIGYFYSAENDMPLDEIGVWNIDIHSTYSGETSAGQLEPPYPEGDLNYDIYVVPPNNPPLGDGQFMTETRKVTQTYPLEIPEGWTDVRAFATVTTPSWILSQEELTVFPAGTSYTYNPTQLAQQYPNVELLEPAEGNHVADVVILTLAMTGTDANGDTVIRTRTYTILHDVTYTYDEAVIR